VLIRTSQLALTNRPFLTHLFRRAFRSTPILAIRPAPTPPATPVGFAAGIGHLQFLPQDHNLLQAAENLFRHAFRQIHKAVILVDINMSDVPALEARLVSNGAYNIPRLHAVDVAHFDSEGLEGNAVRSALVARRLAPLGTILALAASRSLLTRLKARSVTLT